MFSPLTSHQVNSSTLNDSTSSSPPSLNDDFGSIPLFKEALVKAPPLLYHTCAEKSSHLEHRLNAKPESSSQNNVFAWGPPLRLTFKKVFDEQDLFVNESSSSFVKLSHSLLAKYPTIKFLYQACVCIYLLVDYVYHRAVFLCTLVLKLAEIFTPLQYLVGCLPFEYESKVATPGNGRERDARFLPHLFALHKTQLKMACAIGKGSNQIRIYDAQRKQYEKYDLNSEHHRKGIRSMEWSSHNADQLLAVCKHGICVWDVATKVNHRYGKCSFLPLRHASSGAYFTITENGTDISCIVGASSTSDRLHVWQLSKGEWFLRFKKPTLMGCIESLVPSPRSTFLAVQPFRHANFRIFENHLQNSVRWVVEDRIQTSAWSPSEKYFFFASRNDCIIHVMEFYRSKPRPRVNYRFSLDFEQYVDENTRESLCGDIFLMRIHGDRMAVAFQDSNLIAIVRCDFQVLTLQPHLFRPVGFIRPFEQDTLDDAEDFHGGLGSNTRSETMPESQSSSQVSGGGTKSTIVDMQFFECYSRGSLLAVLFSDKTVQFFPLNY